LSTGKIKRVPLKRPEPKVNENVEFDNYETENILPE